MSDSERLIRRMHEVSKALAGLELLIVGNIATGSAFGVEWPTLAGKLAELRVEIAATAHDCFAEHDADLLEEMFGGWVKVERSET